MLQLSHEIRNAAYAPRLGTAGEMLTAVLLLVALLATLATPAAQQQATSANPLQVSFIGSDVSRYTLACGGQLWYESAPVEFPAGGGGASDGAAGPAGPAQPGPSLRQETAEDAIGTYTSREQTYEPHRGEPYALSVKVYKDSPLAVFSTRFPQGLAAAAPHHRATSWSDPTLAPILGFPSIPVDTGGKGVIDTARWIVWNEGQLGTTMGLANISAMLRPAQTPGKFASDNFVASPLVLFDNASTSTLIIAPVDHFHGSLCRLRDGQHGAWGCGISNLPASLPRNFTSSWGIWAGANHCRRSALSHFCQENNGLPRQAWDKRVCC